MTDDIVTRLNNDCLCIWHETLGRTSHCLLCQAADEIERLRALLVHGLTEGYDCKGCDLCKELKAIYLEAVKNGF